MVSQLNDSASAQYAVRAWADTHAERLTNEQVMQGEAWRGNKNKKSKVVIVDQPHLYATPKKHKHTRPAPSANGGKNRIGGGTTPVASAGY